MLRLLRATRTFPVLVGLVAVVLVSGGLAFVVVQQQAQSQLAAGLTQTTLNGTPLSQIGRPAILPTRSVAEAATASGDYVAGATYTADYVRSYLAIYPAIFIGYGGFSLNIVRVSFLSKAQAEQLTHQTLNGKVPDGGVVCYVKVIGPWGIGPFSPPSLVSVSPPNYSWGWMLFDGMTGNLIANVGVL